MIENMKHLKHHIFAPKASDVIAATSNRGDHSGGLDEPRKMKKVCMEETRHFLKPSPSSIAATTAAPLISTIDTYSFGLFMSKKLQLKQQQQQAFESNTDQLSMMTIENVAHEVAAANKQNKRKEDTGNYVELPYKKQTAKEVAAQKKVFYHYSILQELLHTLSKSASQPASQEGDLNDNLHAGISMALTQEDINEDL